jgi:hypothetical protein
LLDVQKAFTAALCRAPDPLDDFAMVPEDRSVGNRDEAPRPDEMIGLYSGTTVR